MECLNCREQGLGTRKIILRVEISDDRTLLLRIFAAVSFPQSLIPNPYSLIPIPYSLFPIPCSLLHSSGDGQLLFQLLLPVEAGVVAIQGEQFVVPAQLDDLAVDEHCDLVGIAHG